jgi:hypothetical protein
MVARHRVARVEHREAEPEPRPRLRLQLEPRAAPEAVLAGPPRLARDDDVPPRLLRNEAVLGLDGGLSSIAIVTSLRFAATRSTILPL